MSSPEIRRIGGALALLWAGGAGPSRAQIQSTLLIAGYAGPDEGNKQQLVLKSIVESDDPTARAIIEELVSLLRESRYFNNPDQGIERVQRVVSECGHQLSDEGYLSWATTAHAASQPQPVVATGAIPFEPPLVPVAHPDTIRPHDVEVSSPTVELLISSLRRLGSGASRPVVVRRRQGRASLRIDDEYDLQDLVELLLRSLYSDVRHEEPTPSSAGSSSRMDLHLREGRTAVEVKVTAPRRGEAHIKPELLIDINDYRGHPTVDTLIAVIYDLAGTFENPAGFEHDLSGRRDGLDIRVLVVPWVGPRATN